MSIVRPIITLKAKRDIKKLRETQSDQFEQLLAGQEDEQVEQQRKKGEKQQLEKTVERKKGCTKGSATRTKGKGKLVELHESLGRLKSTIPNSKRPRRISKAPTKLDL